MLYKEILSAYLDLINSKIFFILITVSGLDILLGKARAFKDNMLNSYTGTRGLVNHSLVIIIALGLGVTTSLFEQQYVSNIFYIFFISDYITSIYANTQLLGIPLPELDFLKEELRRKENNVRL